MTVYFTVSKLYAALHALAPMAFALARRARGMVGAGRASAENASLQLS